MSRRGVLTGAAGIAAGLALPQCTGDTTDSRRVRPSAPAGVVAGMLGVRTDLAAANSSRYGDVALVGRALNGLGVRHIRERLVVPSSNVTQADNQRLGWARLAEMVPRLRVSGIAGVVDDSEGTVAEYADYVESSLSGNQGVIGSVENGNEPNALDVPWNQDDPYGWVPLTRARQRQLAQQFRTRPHLRGISVLGPSLTGGDAPKQYQHLGDISQYLDIGNFHLYPGNTEIGTPSAELSSTIRNLRVNIGDRPYWCTETGMHQAVRSPAPLVYHPEDVAAEYVARIPFEHLMRGVSRVYLFELLDDVPDPRLVDNQAHFGLLRFDTGGAASPKAAYVTLQRLLGLLHDAGPRFTARGEELTLRGAPPDLRHVLLEKRDSSRYLCLWRDVPLWDVQRNKAMPVEPVQVDVQLQRAADVRRFVPTVSSRPLREQSGVQSTSVDMGGSLTVLEIA